MYLKILKLKLKFTVSFTKSKVSCYRTIPVLDDTFKTSPPNRYLRATGRVGEEASGLRDKRHSSQEAQDITPADMGSVAGCHADHIGSCCRHLTSIELLQTRG